jgi:two-component system chemotaxis response regulator CheY
MSIQKVMVVDDDASTRTQCKEILVENGIEVVEAANGAEAISVYGDFRPDLVFMDITIPDSECLATLQEIFVMDPRAKVTMAMVLGQQSSVKLAIKLGAMDFVIKPFCHEQVMRTVYRTWN